ncbi:MAG: OmpA family protein [Phycisphaerales bacterium]|nr:OmpA family protein [Phycisphaerales bacterium]
MPKRTPPPDPTVPEWVLTYGDLMSLLLCFFILLAAFSEIKKPREYAQAVQSMQQALSISGGRGIIRGGQTRRDPNPANAPRTGPGDERSASDTNAAGTAGRDELVSRIHEGKLFAVGGVAGFEAGAWALAESDKDALRDFAEKIRGQNYKVMVRGHAWGIEDKSTGLDYTDLSFKRARAAADFLADECGIRRELLMPVAVGNSEPHVANRANSAGTQANRRVEVMVTEVLLEELHPDPNWQGRDARGT